MLTFKCFFVLYFLSWLFVKISFFIHDRFASCCFQSSVNALVTLYVQFLCSDWSKFDRWVYAENCSILKLVYCDSWSWQSFVSTCGVFNCLFLLDVRNEIQLQSRVFCYSWLVCLLGFWLRNTSPVKVGNPISDGIDSFSFFTLLDWKVWSDVASRSYLSNYCICVCFFIYLIMSNFMKPSAVYEAIVYACLN